MLKLMSGNQNNESPSCEKNSDCPSNICKLIYRNGEPIGRKCLSGASGRYTKSCTFPKDCQSGICEPIYDSGKLVAKRCAKAQKINRDNSYDKLLQKNSGYEKDGKYGVMSNHAIQSGLQQQGKAGPVTNAIVTVISLIFDLFSIIVYDFRVKSYDHANQGLLYGLLATISLNIFSMFDQMTIGIPGGLISGIASSYNKEDGKCDVNESRPIDMWYIRTIITLIFPPLGVLMAKGFSGYSYIIISCLLTALFYFPGLVYSLAIISSSRYGLHEAEERKVGREKQN